MKFSKIFFILYALLLLFSCKSTVDIETVSLGGVSSGVAQTPTATDDVFIGWFSTGVTSAIDLDVLSNDSEVSSYVLQSCVWNGVGHGTISVSGNKCAWDSADDTIVDSTYSFDYVLDNGAGDTLTATATIKVFTAHTWVGAIDDDWDKVGNWCGSLGPNDVCLGNGTVPSNNDDAYFNNTCTTSCDVQITGIKTVNSIILQSGYTDIVTQAPGATLSVISNDIGLVVKSGTFQAVNSTKLTLGILDLSGGFFGAPATDLFFGTNVNPSTTSSGVISVKGGVFAHNNGLVTYRSNKNTHGSITLDVDTTFYDFKVTNHWIEHTTLKGRAIIENDLTFANLHHEGGIIKAHASGANIDLHGDLIINTVNHIYSGGVVITLLGTGDQNVSGIDHKSRINQLIINKPSGTTFFSGNVVIAKSFIHTSGIVDAGTSHITWGEAKSDIVRTLDVANISFNDFHIRPWYRNVSTIVGDLNIEGDLTVSGHHDHFTTSGGPIYLGGNLDIGTIDDSFAVPIHFVGSNNQTFSQSVAGYKVSSDFFINKPAGVVSLTQNITAISNSDLTLTQGTLDLLGFTLDVDQLTVESGTTIDSYSTINHNSLIDNGATLNP